MPTLQSDAPAVGAAAWAGLSASLGTIATAMAKEQERARQLAGDIQYVPGIAMAFSSPGAANPALMGPRTGFAWAVQHVMVAAAADTDAVALCRGTQQTDGNNANTLLQAWVGGGNSNVVSISGFNGLTYAYGSGTWMGAWHPGRTGLILQWGESLVVESGTASGVLVVDVIQMSVKTLPYFLL